MHKFLFFLTIFYFLLILHGNVFAKFSLNVLLSFFNQSLTYSNFLKILNFYRYLIDVFFKAIIKIKIFLKVLGGVIIAGPIS